MLGMDRIYVIKHKWHHEGLSIRQIARDLGVSRNTVRKYVDAEREPRRREAGKRPQPVLAKVRERIDEILREWGQRTTPKQRITGTLVHKQLLGEGYQVLRCAPPAEVSCTIDGAECGRWSFRSECVPGAERWNGGTAEQWPDESE